MKIEITIQGRRRTVELTRPGERSRWTIDGDAIEADAVEVSPGIFSVIVSGESFEARVEGKSSNLRVFTSGKEYTVAIENPRALKKNREGAAEAHGRQNILAPMAGKIVRVLVSVGGQVQGGQGLAIVEAMKMQNEIRSSKSGKIERLGVVEGQTVNAGDTIAIVI
jgi:biotin carboxyl carrier protein